MSGATPPPQALLRRRGGHAKPALETTPGQLTPNNDGDERRDLRRQSAARVLRKSLGGGGAAGLGPAPQGRQGQGLNAAELQAMYERVIRLTAENKITKGNVWELNIIHHMPDIIKSESLLLGQQFNFQRASCGLDAGVNIYSKRVDSVYDTMTETLGGCKAAKRTDEDDEADDGAGDRDQDGGEGDGDAGRAKGSRRKDAAAYVDPSSTLADAQSLRAKEVEPTFDSDPLFGRTSKLFDESSAAGLLMLNLGVYGGCEILFDSDQVPTAGFPIHAGGPPAWDDDVLVDISGLPWQRLVAAGQDCFRITPSIELLVAQLDPSGSWAEGDLADPGQILRDALEEEAKWVRSSGYGARRMVRRQGAQGAAASQAAGDSPEAEDMGMQGAGDGDVEGGYGGGHPDTGVHDDDDGGDTMDVDMPGTPGGGGGDGGAAPSEQQQQQQQQEHAEEGGQQEGLGGGDEGFASAPAGGFEVDDDGFVAAPFDGDGDDLGAAGAADGGLVSDGEGADLEDETAEDPDDLPQWLTSQARSMASARQQPAARSNSACAGAGFWRYSGPPAAAGSAAAAAAGGKKEPVKRAKSKQAGALPRLDSDDEDPELEARLANKLQPAETQLRQRSRAKTLLPEDLRLDASSRLFTILRTPNRSHDIVSIWHCHATAAIAAARAARSAGGGRTGSQQQGGQGGRGGDGGPGGGFGAGDDGDGGGYGGGCDGGGEDDGGGDVPYHEGVDEEEAARAGAEEAARVLMQAAALAAAGAGLLAPGGVQLPPWLQEDAQAGSQQQQDGLGGDGSTLPAPRRVQRVEVSYDKVAKVVDVKLLKEVIHSNIRQQLLIKQEQQEGGQQGSTPAELPFQEVISGLQAGASGGATGSSSAPSPAPFKDLSVHLCFICLLHLANEHGLQLSNHGRLDQLSVCSGGKAGASL